MNRHTTLTLEPPVQKWLKHLPGLLTSIVFGIWLAYWTWVLLPHVFPEMVAAPLAESIPREKSSQELLEEIAASPWFSQVGTMPKAEPSVSVNTELKLVGILSSQTERNTSAAKKSGAHAVALVRLASGKQIPLKIGQMENTPQGEIRVLDIGRDSVRLRVQAEELTLKLHDKASLEIPVMASASNTESRRPSNPEKSLKKSQGMAAAGHEAAASAKKTSPLLPSNNGSTPVPPQPAAALQPNPTDTTSSDGKYQPAESALSARRKLLNEAHIKHQDEPAETSQNSDEPAARPAWWQQLKQWWGD